MAAKTTIDTGAWDSVNDSINFGAERYILKASAWVRLYDEVFYPITGIHPDDAERDRKHRLEDRLTLGILEKSLPANALDFYTRNEATKRLVNAGIISKKKRTGWKINKKADPRRKTK